MYLSLTVFVCINSSEISAGICDVHQREVGRGTVCGLWESCFGRCPLLSFSRAPRVDSERRVRSGLLSPCDPGSPGRLRARTSYLRGKIERERDQHLGDLGSYLLYAERSDLTATHWPDSLCLLTQLGACHGFV